MAAAPRETLDKRDGPWFSVSARRALGARVGVQSAAAVPSLWAASPAAFQGFQRHHRTDAWMEEC